MKSLLLATTAIAALAAQLQFARAADIDVTGNIDYPTAFISFEGGIALDASPANVDFDDEDSKLGELGSLQPGDRGWQGRFELGQRLDSEWDYRIGLAAMSLGEDATADGDAEAFQTTSLQTFDVEAGYRSNDLGVLQARLFAGVRGLHAATEADWSEDDKIGEFDDRVYAVGPRIGADLALPLGTSNVLLLGSASGSILFGQVESTYRFDHGNAEQTRWSDGEVIWNVEAMAGVSFGVGENADLTLGYRAARFGGLMADRSDVDSDGSFTEDGRSDLMVHGPFARLTIEIP